MEDIKHTYTIQWVGPLTYDEYKEYVKGKDVLCFNIKCNWYDNRKELQKY